MTDSDSPEVVLYGPVSEQMLASLRAGKLPDAEGLKAAFPAVADRIEAFASKFLADARTFQGLTRGEVVRALEWLLATVRAGEIPDADAIRKRHPWLSGEVREAGLVPLAAGLRQALWLAKELWQEPT